MGGEKRGDIQSGDAVDICAIESRTARDEERRTMPGIHTLNIEGDRIWARSWSSMTMM